MQKNCCLFIDPIILCTHFVGEKITKNCNKIKTEISWKIWRILEKYQKSDLRLQEVTFENQRVLFLLTNSKLCPYPDRFTKGVLLQSSGWALKFIFVSVWVLTLIYLAPNRCLEVRHDYDFQLYKCSLACIWPENSLTKAWSYGVPACLTLFLSHSLSGAWFSENSMVGKAQNWNEW